MTRNEQTFISWIIFAAFLGFIVGASFFAQATQNSNTQYEQASAKSNANSVSKDVPADERIAEYTLALDVLTAVLAISTVGLWIVTSIGSRNQSRDMRDAIQATRNQLTLSFPPRLIITNVQLISYDPNDMRPDLKPGVQYKIAVFIVNSGRDDAIIKKIGVKAHWQKGPLPMRKPIDYDIGEPSILRLQIGHTREYSFHSTASDIKMPPGQVAFCEVPATCADDSELYAIGFIEYRDPLNTRRATQFCRRYDRERWCFVPGPEHPQFEREE